MAKKKESYFWTSYSDLMTSLFFVMLILFIIVIVILHKGMEATEAQLQAIKEVVNSTEELNHSQHYEYRPDYKKYVLKIQVRYPTGKSNINEIIAEDKEQQLNNLAEAGREIQRFLQSHPNYQYILIIEGQASLDNYRLNYELSYERALALMRFWVNDRNIKFGKNCEILISGSGDGTLDTHSMRENSEEDNQRFLIHILPKNIIEDEKPANQ